MLPANTNDIHTEKKLRASKNIFSIFFCFIVWPLQNKKIIHIKMWKGEIQVKCLNNFTYRSPKKKRKLDEISYTVHEVPGFEVSKNDIAIVVQRKQEDHLDTIHAEIVSFKEITKGRNKSRIVPPVEFDKQLSIDKYEEDEDEEDEDTKYFPLRICFLTIVKFNKKHLVQFLNGYSVPNLIDTSYKKFVKIDLFYCKGREFSKYYNQKGLGEKLMKAVLAQYDLKRFPIVLEADTRDPNATQNHKLFTYYKKLGFDNGPFPRTKDKKYSTAIMYKLPQIDNFAQAIRTRLRRRKLRPIKENRSRKSI